MPELPEVEVVRQYLIKELINKKINKVDVFYLPIVSNDTQFSEKIINQTIKDIKRIGKFLIFELDDIYLVSHLRMEGKYFFNQPKNKHVHLEFYLDDNLKLSYQDTRKFGRFEIYSKESFNFYKIKNLAKEPYDLTPEQLLSSLKNKKIAIKDAILDQRIILGLGNIYASEVLFKAKIHPAKIANTLTHCEVKLIINYSIDIFNQSIINGGASVSSFSALNHQGSQQEYLFVYDKENQPCINCMTPIKRIKQSGRSTYFCPNCQKRYVIGITGGIATGKTTVSNYLKSKGYQVIETDLIVSDLYKENQTKEFIKKTFDIQLNTKEDKKKLADLVFSNPEKLKILSDYIHPIVLKKVEDIISQSPHHLIFVDVPLLFEVGNYSYDKSLLIYINQDEQIKRLMKRDNLTRKDALQRINSQLSIEEKKHLADDVIDNHNSQEDLKKQIDNYLRRYSINEC